MPDLCALSPVDVMKIDSYSFLIEPDQEDSLYRAPVFVVFKAISGAKLVFRCPVSVFKLHHELVLVSPAWDMVV